MKNNPYRGLYFVVILFVVSGFMGLALVLDNDAQKDDRYLAEAYPDANYIYENVVTEESNDYFVVVDNGEETTYYVELNHDNNTHTEKEITDDTPSLAQMNETSISTDQRPQPRERSGNLDWIPVWFILNN